MSQMSFGTFLVSLLAAGSGSAQIVGLHFGLPMVPTRCMTDQRKSINVENLLVFHNKAISFHLEKLVVRTEIVGNHVESIYSDEPGTSIFNIGAFIPYRANDIRLYHGSLNNKPVLYWEEVVENVPGRAGILEYRGRSIFSVCTGVINRVSIISK